MNDALDRKQRELAEIRKALREVNVRRKERRAREEREARQDSKRALRELLRDQEDAFDDLERLENWLARLTDDDPANDPDPDRARSIKYLIAEIDILRHEIDARRTRLHARRLRTRRHGRHFRRLDRKAEAADERKVNLVRREHKVMERIAEIRKELRQNEWPNSMAFSELLYHDPPHLHIASANRPGLIAICKIAEKRGIRVGEFPPFDTVECVHVSGSWHYRDSGSPFTPRDCSNRGDGLAADLNDADGGSDKEVAFYRELVARY